LSNEPLNINNTSPQSVIEDTDFVESNIGRGSNNKRDNSKRGNSRRCNNRSGGGNRRDVGSEDGNRISRRGLRSQDQRNTNSINDDNWNVLLPENIEDQIRITRSKRRS
jgi:hypothetical protein